MITFALKLKEEDKYPERIITRDFEGKEASELFKKVKEEFSDYLVKGDQEDQPFLYMDLCPVTTGHEKIGLASLTPQACFKTEISEQIIEFIKQN
ncbi:hypothetical protein O0Q50_32055 [Priestia aryabhattai]|uniref:Uncharacterized protein n=1 Tax=Priestia aryabhattai TaxID=412384 RepID=A0AAX6NIX1_PRIAR|nr:hypothetical protein [Priestia aryabhattai]MDU9695802.1 hypothetical protein [Priestia aryabhattai]